jgi:1-deoxy-D-xylulose-5-phosphate reductoisomerase
MVAEDPVMRALGEGNAPRRVSVLGSTGTIGRLTLDVIARLPDRLEVMALAGWKNGPLLAEQTLRFRPETVAIGEPAAAAEFREIVGDGWQGEVLEGHDGIVALAEREADVVVNGLVGANGLAPSVAALRMGRVLGLANKESLVIGGELLRQAAIEGGGRILPIDSEHSGLMQCLDGKDPQSARRVILTASGGPFRTWPLERIPTAQPAEALRHPTWNMGPRITVDSATLLNKGFEIHEARWLFDLPEDRIDVWIHPQSIVHALVEWPDGSMMAQMSAADMRLPIQYALCYPERPAGGLPRCDLAQTGRLEFEEVDPDRYPCLGLARAALRMQGTAPAVLNAADEVLIAAYLEGRISFGEIARLLSVVLEEHRNGPHFDLETIIRADREARVRTMALIGNA